MYIADYCTRIIFVVMHTHTNEIAYVHCLDLLSQEYCQCFTVMTELNHYFSKRSYHQLILETQKVDCTCYINSSYGGTV